MNAWTKAIAAVAVVLCASGCATFRQVRDPAKLPPDGSTRQSRIEGALDYSVAIRIEAPASVVWSVLTDAPSYTSWNSTIVKLEGAIAKDGELKLVSKDAPTKTFDLKVTTFDAPTKMIWEDGGMMFLGVRTFTLIPSDDGKSTTFAMQETFSGGFLFMIEGALPDFTMSFNAFARDLKKAAEAKSATAPG